VSGKSAILAVKIITDASKGSKGLDEAAGKVGKFQSAMGKAAAPAAAVLGGLVALGKGALDAASETEQAMGAVQSVFGKSADKITAWADNSAKAVGLSKTQYGNLAALIGAQLKNLGVPLDAAAESTNGLITLGADLAATFGGTTADAVSALSSALKGEADPAERYGLALNQTAVNAYLAAKGQDKLTGAAASQAKAAAIVAMATEQAAGAVGQFARESDTAAGSAEIAKAQFANVTSELGAALLPAAVAVAQALSVVAGWMQKNSAVTKILIGVVATLAGLILLYNAYLKVTAIVSKAAWLASLGPIGLVIAAVIAIVAVIVVLWNKCKWFRDAVTAAWSAIRQAAEVAWRAVSSAILAVVSAVVSAWQKTVGVITAVWQGISSAASAIWAAISTVIRAVTDAVVKAWQACATAVKAIWSGIEAAARVSWGAVTGVVQGIVNAIVAIWQGIVSTVSGIWHSITSAVTSALEPIRSVIQGIRDAWDSTVGKISDGISKVSGWLGGIADKLGGLGAKIGKVASGALSVVTPGSVVVSSPTLLGRGAAVPLGGPTRSTPTGSGGQVVNLTINGAIDADGTARTVTRVLSARVRRVGPIRLGGVLA
jgi:phage-related protein